jgi:predicted nucleic acid-binding Zn ribbon protein
MENAAERPSGEVCHRCLQPIAPNAQTCPNCGERHSPRNRLPIFIGILGLLALVFIAVIMFKTIQNSDADSAPPDQTDEQSAPQTPDRPPPLNP